MLHRRLMLAALPTLVAGGAFAQTVGTTTAPAPLSTPSVQGGQVTNVVDTLASAGGFNQFLGLLQRAGVIEQLRGAGPFILLAPNDVALNRAPQSFISQLAPAQPTGQQSSGDPERLRAFANSHIVQSDLRLSAIMGRNTELRTRNGNVIVIEAQPGTAVRVLDTMQGGQGAGGLSIEGRQRNIEVAEIRATNGVVWPISLPILV
ncbi:fasciclin domain-containing protein [Roseococcus suduntuyensis]|uniref:Putative surface protein with fasciclin (FAS1) repeats n=1 Tax=Roseococcus suduntuyensis TaxID=455361 RepID=A0A840AI82_9PROT|nr:fasciclin domain-containing protein [Roseococcus suduntuyensis]MBB3899864.1 putative surface protein with fasciclin (FAS1) repeats [Roseococcus suduntuyensis]